MGVLACVLEDVEQPPWLLPSRCQGQPLLNCNDPNSRRFQKYPWSGGYQNHCGLRTTDLDDPEVNAPHKQGSLTSLRATCPSATAVAHIWEACVASATENPLVNPRGDVEAVPVLEEDYVWGASCSETTSLWDIQESPPPSPCVPGGEAQSPVRDPEQEVSSAVQIPTLTSLDCFAFYNFIRTLVKKKNFFFCFYSVATSYFCVSKNLKRRLNLNTSFTLNSQFRREQLSASCSVKLLLSGLKIQLMESSNSPPVWIFLYHKADNDCTTCHIGSPWLSLAEFFTLTIPGLINACYTNKSPGIAQDGIIINYQIFVPSRI